MDIISPTLKKQIIECRDVNLAALLMNNYVPRSVEEKPYTKRVCICRMRTQILLETKTYAAVHLSFLAN
jgi:hypothetical protein